LHAHRQYLKSEYLRHGFCWQAAKRFYKEYAPNLTETFLRADPGQHFFWHCMEPESVETIPDGEVEKFGDAIRNWYIYLDVIVSDRANGPSGKLPSSDSNNDAPDGIIILSGEGVNPLAYSEGASVYDVTPTILGFMRLPIGRGMDGRILSETIVLDFLERKLLTCIGTQDLVPCGGSVGVSSRMDGAVIRRLKGLGYYE